MVAVEESGSPDTPKYSVFSSERYPAYAGRWIACLGERVIAQGGAPDQALAAARAIRYKERPWIAYVTTLQPLIYPELFDAIRAALPGDQRIYLVGGAVRDALLGKAAHDLDFCTARDPSPLARRIANRLDGAFFSLDDERNTVRVLYTAADGARYSIDFAQFRGADLETDLRGRDFTINAMAVDASDPQVVLDPLGGQADLRAGQLRGCTPIAFEDDPLRILRGVRLAASLNFHIVPETRQAMRNAVTKLAQVSAERKRDELFRILEGPQPSSALRALDWLGSLPYLLPELIHLKDIPQSAPHTLDVWNHTLAALEQLRLLLDSLAAASAPDEILWIQVAVNRFNRFRGNLDEHFSRQLNPNRSLAGLLALAVLYHDVAKPATHEEDESGRIQNLGHEKVGAEAAVLRAQALQLSNAETDWVRTVVRQHMRIHSLVQTGAPPTRRAIYRYFRDTDEAGVDICIHTLADTLATYGPKMTAEVWERYLDTCEALLQSWWNEPRAKILPKGILNGHDLQRSFKVPPGPRLGLLLDALREAEAIGTVRDREEALAFAQEWLKVYPGREA